MRDPGAESPVLESIDSVPIGRKAFLSGSLLSLIGLAVGRVRVAAAAQPVASKAELAAFLRLSRIASGVSDLPASHVREYFSALEADGVLKLKPSSFARLAGVTGAAGPSTLAELERSPAFRAPGGKECLETIASVWWSGIVPTAGGGQRVVTFTDALVWRQVHEPTTCQGATGSWAKPGRAVE